MTTTKEWNARSAGTLPGLLGVELLEVAPDRVASRLAVRAALLAPNGYLHAATVVALADTSCGYGTLASLPAAAEGFTTLALTSNFLGTARAGGIACIATRVHSGRTTQVWDARVSAGEEERLIALFRCTQMILYPQRPSPRAPG